MAANTSARPQDLTGHIKETKEREAAALKEAEAKRLAEAAGAKPAEDEEVQWEDAEAKAAREREEAEKAKKDGVVIFDDVDVKEKLVKFKVREDLEAVTIGAGTFYNFEAGKTYNYPKYIYDHLEEKGMIWH
jgi:hypothetical protein